MSLSPLPRAGARRWPCWLLLGLLVVVLMRGWWPPGVPLSARREILPEFAYAWLAREHLSQGYILTDWSVYEFAGFPWLRYIPYPLYYLVGGLSLLTGLPIEWAYRLLFWATFTLAGVGAFEYVRRLAGSDLGGLAAGIAYALAPFHAHITVEVFAHSVAWALVPWPFLAYETLSQRREWPDGVGFGLLLGLFPVVSIEYTLLLAPFLGAYLLWREVEGFRRGQRSPRATVTFFAVAGAVAVGCSAFVVLPGLLETSMVGIHAKHASGAAIHWDLLRDYAMPPQALLAALLRRLRAAWPVSLPAVYRSYQASAWYLGWSAVGLGVLGVLRPPRRGLGWLFGLLALLGVVRAAGPWVPGNFFLYLPVIGKLTPFRSLGLLAFCLAVLAGFGTAALRRWLGRWSVGNWLTGAAVLALVAELYGPASAAFVSWPTYFSPAEREAYRWVQSQPGGFRVWEFPQDHRDEYLFTYSLPHLPRPRFGGYFDNGAPLHMWHLAMAATYPPGEVHPLTGPALRLYSTRWVLLRRDRDNYAQGRADLEKLGFGGVAFENQAVTVLADPATLPYARWRAEAVLFVGSKDPLPVLEPCLGRNLLSVHATGDQLAAWTTEELARFRQVVLADDVPLPTSVQGRLEEAVGTRLVSWADWAPGPPAPTPGDVRLQWSRPSPLEVQVALHTPQDGWLEIAEAWYPHWRVEVDGQAARLLRTNVAFQGVWVPAGEHQVRFIYRWPWTIWGSFALSAVALALSLGILLRERMRKGSTCV